MPAGYSRYVTKFKGSGIIDVAGEHVCMTIVNGHVLVMVDGKFASRFNRAGFLCIGHSLLSFTISGNYLRVVVEAGNHIPIKRYRTDAPPHAVVKSNIAKAANPC